MKYENNYFDFRYVRVMGEKICLSKDSVVLCENECYALTYMRRVIEEAEGDTAVSVNLIQHVPDSIKDKINAYEDNDEGYVIEITNNTVNICSETHRGLIYGVSTIKQFIETGTVAPMILFDCPDKSMRGYRVYTPGNDLIDVFKDVIDTLVYYKYNTVMIEVGGAMEYEKHPEINEMWVKFCSEVNKSPYEAERIQLKTHPGWKKDSIHSENGEGSFITKAQMRDLVKYCRERELTVIPEVPSMSHSDYIVMAHRDLNERVEDTYPDTYCPSNPKTYEILFDILDEVIEVFNPEYLNIGHDELYTVGICDKCKDKTPVELYVDDIVKIYNYLKKRNIKTMMWGEKLYNIHLIDPDGKPWATGGAGNDREPMLYPCRNFIPTDVIQLHWLWLRANEEQEKEISDLGFKSFYGNFLGPELENYRKRSANTDGGFVSNWGSFKEEYMQRNGQNFYLASTAYIFWNGEYDSPMREYVYDITKKELYRRYLKSLGNEIIEITHTTELSRPYVSFYCGCFIVPEEHTIGWHVVTYEDGTVVKLPVIYGYNIRYAYDRPTMAKSTEAIPDAAIEPIGASLPQKIGDKTFYKTAYRNPYPAKSIKTIVYEPKNDVNVEVLG